MAHSCNHLVDVTQGFLVKIKSMEMPAASILSSIYD